MKGPDFERPPVIEVALSVQFASQRSLTTAHVARYWEIIRDRFPNWREGHLIEPAIELFGAPLVRMPRFEIQLRGGIPRLGEGILPNRALFEDAAGVELVQVQYDRFVRNWRCLDGSREYPRYPALRARFGEDLNGFRDFLANMDSSALDINQCEITYVNHLPAGEGWLKHSEVGAVVGPLSGSTTGDMLLEPETVEATFRYVFTWPGEQNPAGRLHVQITPVHRITDGSPMLKLVLTARGRPRGSETAQVLEWLDVGHDFLVNAFAALTTPSMHKIWRRHDVR